MFTGHRVITRYTFPSSFLAPLSLSHVLLLLIFAPWRIYTNGGTFTRTSRQSRLLPTLAAVQKKLKDFTSDQRHDTAVTATEIAFFRPVGVVFPVVRLSPFPHSLVACYSVYSLLLRSLLPLANLFLVLRVFNFDFLR